MLLFENHSLQCLPIAIYVFTDSIDVLIFLVTFQFASAPLLALWPAFLKLQVESFPLF